MGKKQVYAFDFDGTLTCRDTLLLFINFACKKWKIVEGACLFVPLVVLMKLRFLPNWKVKQWLFSFFFADMEEDKFNLLCRLFSIKHKSILRPEGMNTVMAALEDGAHVLIVSASVDNWVALFFVGLPVEVIGTQIEVRDGKLTGRFKTRNCYGSEKVKRILEKYPSRQDYTLVAYGDSRGDKEMMEFADVAHYVSG